MRRLVIFDTESGYTQKLTAILSSDPHRTFEVLGFTDREKVTASLSARQPELLLLGEKDYVPELARKADCTIVLRETGNLAAAVPAVDKYQPVSSLMRDILVLYKPGEMLTDPLPAGSCRVIGVAGPVGRCGRTLFSLTLGMQLAEMRPALWLTLDAFSPLTKWLGKSSGKTLSDLLYKAQTDAAALPDEIGSAAEMLRALHCIPPARLAEDLAETDASQIVRLLAPVRRLIFAYVILDIGSFPDPAALLAACDVIYEPVRTDIFSEEKQAQFRTYLAAHGIPADAVRPLRLPSEDTIRDLASLPLTTLGTFTRAQIRRDGL